MSDGRYGKFGGQYLPETLMPAVAELERAFEDARRDEAFQHEFDRFERLCTDSLFSRRRERF